MDKLIQMGRGKLVLFSAVAFTCALAQGGIKYWDNPEYKTFDVGDYVPGAVWHYDGICNQGTNVAHSMTATTWKTSSAPST